MSKYLIEFPEGREYFPEFLPIDDFYSGIYIAPEHIKAWRSEYYSDTLVGTSLIEEMSELTKALCKERRAKSYDPEIKASIKEEIAHVLISLKGYCMAHGITSESIETEIQKKWPTAYSKEKTDE